MRDSPLPADRNVVTGRFGTERASGEATPAEPVAAESAAGEPDAAHGASLAEEYLEAAVGLGYRPLPPRRATLADAYFDTAAFDLLRAGLALRLRGTASGVLVTLKSLDRPGYDDLESQRLEVGGPVGDVARPLDPASWPEAVRDRVRAAAGESPRLLPMCVLHQRRMKVPLMGGGESDGTAVADLSLDLVDVFDPHGAAADDTLQGVSRLIEDGVPIVTFSELSVEPAAEGAQDLLGDLARRLRAMPDLAPSAGSKLEQALEALADHPAGAASGETGISSGMPMAEAGRLMWRRQLVAMLLNEAGARRGKDIEYVHDMRVATRRARAVARLFGPFFDRKALRGHLRNLRRTARALGAVRDADVALLKLREYADSRPAGERQGLAEIRAVWRVERRQAYRTLLDWLDSPDYRAFVAEFAELCRTPGLDARPAANGSDGAPSPSRVGHVMPSAILNRFEQVRAYERLFASGEPVPAVALHALRIDCKALRYSLEPVEHLLGEEGKELVRQLKRLQDLLGDLHDAVVADARLAELADVVEAAALVSYRTHQQSVLAELVAAAPAAWESFVALDNRRRLAAAIARL